MHRIAIIHDPSSHHALTWKLWLEAAQYKVDTIYDEDSLGDSKNTKYDLIIPLITISDYTSKDNARMRAVSYFEAQGAKVLSSSRAIAASSDKLETANILRRHSLPHPLTSLADKFVWNRECPAPLMLKPRFGHSGNGIHLVQTEEAFKQYRGSNMLAQSFIEHAECIRIITSQSEILSAYKKIPPEGEVVANIDRGAKRLPLVLTTAMSQLACTTVQVLGGGLMGVDLLDSPEGLYILEANVPFGFDADDTAFRAKLVAYIQKVTR